MHISEGVLSSQTLAAGWVITGVGTAVGLKKLDPDKIVRVAVFSSAFFLASLVNLRFGTVSTHLSLVAPVGLILGWSVFPAVLTALLLQALLLQSGGIIVLGANTANMALPGLMVYLLFAAQIRANNTAVAGIFAFSAGALAVFLSAVGAACLIYLSNPEMAGVAKFFLGVHVPLALLEGGVTFFMVSFLKKTSPDILRGVDRR